MSALRKIETNQFVRLAVLRGDVSTYATFERPRELIESTDKTSRPIEALVPKRAERKRLAQKIGILKCRLLVPPHVRCTENAVFQGLRNLTVSVKQFSHTELLSVLPELVDGHGLGVETTRQNCFLLNNSAALVVWRSHDIHNSLVARLRSWREALAECTNNDLVFCRYN